MATSSDTNVAIPFLDDPAAVVNEADPSGSEPMLNLDHEHEENAPSAGDSVPQRRRDHRLGQLVSVRFFTL